MSVDQKRKDNEVFHQWVRWYLIGPFVFFLLPILLSMSLIRPPVIEFLKNFAGGETLLISAMLLLGLYVEVNYLRLHDSSFKMYDQALERASNAHFVAFVLISVFAWYKSLAILLPFSNHNPDIKAVYTWTAALAFAISFASAVYAYKTKKLIQRKRLSGIK